MLVMLGNLGYSPSVKCSLDELVANPWAKFHVLNVSMYHIALAVSVLVLKRAKTFKW